MRLVVDLGALHIVLSVLTGWLDRRATPHPEAVFMQQIVRTLTMVEAGAPAPDVLICDRDRKWSGDVRRRL